MTRVTLTIDDRIEEIDARISELRDDQDALEAEAEALPDPGDVDDEDEGAVDPVQRRQELYQQYRSLAEDIRALEHTQEILEAKQEAWGGGEFVIEEFSFGDQATANDLFLEDINREGKQAPEEAWNARKIRIVQVGVRETPPEAPAHPNQFPPAIGEWLYESIEDLNTYGEVGLDDFSIPSALTDE